MREKHKTSGSCFLLSENSHQKKSYYEQIQNLNSQDWPNMTIVAWE